MAKKTWKLGEVCQGGIITVEIIGKSVVVINKEWDYAQGSRRSSNQTNAEELSRHTVKTTNNNAERSIDNYLNDLTTSYYSGQILDWIKSKVKFESMMWW